MLDSEIAEVNAGLQWTSQFSGACRGVLDASNPVEIATALAIVDVLADQAPNPGPGEWAEGIGAQLRAPARQTMQDTGGLSSAEARAPQGLTGPPRDLESNGAVPAPRDAGGSSGDARTTRPR